MYHKNRLYRRQQRKLAILRKSNIARFAHLESSSLADPRHRGALSKGKIHCSCPLCSCKSTRRFGHTCNSLYAYKHTEYTRITNMHKEIQDFDISA